MKKLVAILLIVMSALVLKAGDEAKNYVNSGGKTYFCQKMKPGLFNANLLMCDGNTLKIPFRNVDSYCCKGRLFERLPLVCQGVQSGKTAFMEYLTSRNGLRLYRYCSYGECGDLINCTYKSAHRQFTFFVYKDGDFYLEVDQRNAPTVLPFFGIEVL